ncbi:hypothetical protein A3758_13875 [Oleiphilus sp. HI0118]|nr:hypothetical protein A3758_13875 [Oleiphilus sp. HI0118]
MELLYYLFYLVPVGVFVLVFLSQPRRSRFALVSFATFFLLFVYVFIPLVGDYAGMKRQNILYSAVVAVAFSCIYLGLILGRKAPSITLYRLRMFTLEKEKRFLIVLICLALLSTFIYVSALGGLSQAIINGVKVRYGGEAKEVGSLAFFLYFIALAKLAGGVTFYRLLQGGDRWSYLLLFAVSTFIVAIFALINASRGSVVMYVILLVFLYINKLWNSDKTSRKNIIKLTVLALTLLPLIFVAVVYGKKIIGSASSSFESGQYEFRFSDYEDRKSAALTRFYDEGSHVSRSLEYVISNSVDFTYFKHFADAFLALIPYRLTGIQKPPKISERNSYNIDLDRTGSRPPGALASLWYGGGFLGLVISCVLSGFVIAQVQKMAEKLIAYNKVVIPYFVYLYFVITFFAFNGDPQIVLKGHFYLFVFFVFWYLSIFKYRFNVQRRGSA